MELIEMEKRLLVQVEGDYQSKILTELYMIARYTKNPGQRKVAENLMAKLRGLTDTECMDIVRDIQKNYRLPYPARTIGEKIAEARQQSGAERSSSENSRRAKASVSRTLHLLGLFCRPFHTAALPHLVGPFQYLFGPAGGLAGGEVRSASRSEILISSPVV